MRLIDWSALDAQGRLDALARPGRRTGARVTDVVRKDDEPGLLARGGFGFGKFTHERAGRDLHV